MVQEEVWLPIAGYEGYYEVSSFGRVRSLTRRVYWTNGHSYLAQGRVLTPRRGKNMPYYTVILCKTGFTRRVMFIGLLQRHLSPTKRDFWRLTILMKTPAIIASIILNGAPGFII